MISTLLCTADGTRLSEKIFFFWTSFYKMDEVRKRIVVLSLSQL